MCVLAQRDIRVSDENGHKKVGAELSAFRCKAGGHIFFVLTQDLKANEEEPQSDWGT